jgi:Mg-chelatase subunit ChlD
MEPYCHEDYQMQPTLLHPLDRMIMMMEINDDDVTITVEIVMVIEEIKEDVEVVVVVDKSNSLETQVRPVSLVVSLT